MAISKNTLLVHIETNTYPLTTAALKHRHPNISFGQEIDEEMIVSLGYAAVQEVQKPEGDVVVETAPVQKADGTYVQNYDVRAFTADELNAQISSDRNIKLLEIERARDEALAIGAPMSFPGQAEVLHAQMRDGDRANILGLRARAEVLQQQGVTNAAIPFRTYEDKTVMLTPAQTITMAWAVFDSYQQVLAASWSLKDAVAAAENKADLDTLVIDFSQEPTVIS